MSNLSIESIINVVLGDQFIIDNIRTIYQKYKRPNMHFFVPIDVQCGSKQTKIKVGNKSYSSLEKLIFNLKLWFTDDQDVQRFSEIIWNNRDNHVISMILVETNSYNFGCIALIPVEGEIKIISTAYIKKFSHVDPTW